MNAKVFALGLLLVFLAYFLNQVTIPYIGTVDWQPIPNLHIPIPTIIYINPFGWLVYPLVFLGSIFLIFGVITNTVGRILLLIIAFLSIICFVGIPGR